MPQAPQSTSRQAWNERLVSARRLAQRREDGHYHLPVRDPSGRVAPIGRWLHKQIRLARQGMLDDSRRRALLNSGFDLNPRRGRPGKRMQEHNPAQIVEHLDDLVKDGRQFGVIYADPPWHYDNQGTRAATGRHYQGMSLDEMAALPVCRLAAADCYLHLWTTNGFLGDAINLMQHWGFEYKSNFVWVKPQMGLGNYWRLSHEILLLGKRGRPVWRARDLMSWAEHPRTAHSAKPEVFRTAIERASQGPYLELFGRRTAPGWTVWGNQIDRNDLLTQLHTAGTGSREADPSGTVSGQD